MKISKCFGMLCVIYCRNAGMPIFSSSCSNYEHNLNVLSSGLAGLVQLIECRPLAYGLKGPGHNSGQVYYPWLQVCQP